MLRLTPIPPRRSAAPLRSDASLRSACPEETLSALEKLLPREKLTLSEDRSRVTRIVLTSRRNIEPSSNKPGWWLGTFGAFLGLKSRTQNRKALFDVAVAGPLAGLVVAVPALWWGLQNSLILKGPAASSLVRFYRHGWRVLSYAGHSSSFFFRYPAISIRH